MCKVIKILGKVLSWFIIALVTLPLLAALLINIPVIQNFVVDKAAELVSKKLETTVSIESITIRAFSKVTASGFYVEDYQGDTLMYAGKLSANISKTALFRNKIILGDISLDKAKIYLFTPKDGEMNLTQVLSHLNSNSQDTTTTKLTFKNIKITNSKFKLQNEGADTIAYGVNYSNMIFDNLNITSRKLEISGSAISMDIKSMSFKDISGIVIEKMTAGNLLIDDGVIAFDKARIAMPDTDLRLNNFRMAGTSWKSMSNVVDSVVFNASATKSTISLRTLSYFVPTIGRYSDLIISDVNIDFNGYINDFKTHIDFISVDNVTSINTDVAIVQVMDIPNASFDINIKRLKSEGNSLKHIVNGFIPDSLTGITSDILMRCGNINLTAKSAGRMKSFKVNANLEASVGGVKLNGLGGIKANGDIYFDAQTSTDGVNAGKLMGNALLGDITLNASANGSIGKANMELTGSINIPSAEFNGYTYTNVVASGSYIDKKVDALVVSKDPKLEFDVNGYADFSDETPSYNVDLDMKRADLHTLNINKKDTTSIISGRLLAKGSGSNLNNINGRAVISNLSYNSSTDNVSADSLIITGQNSNDSHFLAFNSPYADIVFKSDIEYDDIISYLRHILYDYLPALDSSGVAKYHKKEVSPTLHPLVENSTPAAQTIGYPGINIPYENHQPDSIHNINRKTTPLSQANNLSELNINIKKANNIAAIFLPGFSIAEGTKANFVFNPKDETFSVDANSAYIEYGKFFVTRLMLNANNITNSDAVIVKFETEDLYLPSFSIPSNNIKATIQDNKIDITARLSNNTTDLNAYLDIKSILSQDNFDGKLAARLIFDSSSYLVTGTKRWDISSDSIQYSTSRIVVDNFKISNEQQQLQIDGVVSDSRSDTLKLTLNKFSINPVNALLGFDSGVIGGKLDGSARLVSGLKAPVLIADIQIDSLSTQGYVASPLILKSNWDFTSEHALVSLQDVSSGKNIIQGFYRPSTSSYFANIDIDQIPAAAAGIFLPSDIVHDIDGSAAILLQVRGSKGMPRIDGTISIKDFATTVDVTNVRYFAKVLDVDIDNNVANISRTMIYDAYENSAPLTATADIRNISNIKYSANLLPENLLVLNTGAKDNDQFYGKVYVSGAANINGSRTGINIDVAATTQDNSALYLPLSNKSSISEATWLKFENVQPEKTLDDIVENKKLSYEKALRTETTRGTEANLRLNVSLNVTPGTLVSLLIPSINSELNVRGSAALDILMNSSTGDMSIFGTYEVADGDFFFSLPPFISNKRFLLQPGGTIQLSGNPMDAKLNIEAMYRLRASLQPIAGLMDGLGVSSNMRIPVECLLRIKENLTNPELSFDVKIPSADAEIQSAINSLLSTSENTALNFITLVALGSFSPDNNVESITGNARGGASSLGIDFLTNQLANMVSSDKFSLILRYRADEVASDELDFGFSYNLNNDRLIFELEGNYDIGNTNPQNLSNISGDASITWLLTPSGNLRLKGFTRTINRYDENQGFQENGIGIYYKEDFNSFRDIVPQYKMRKLMRREKKAIKVAEEAANTKTDASSTKTTSSSIQKPTTSSTTTNHNDSTATNNNTTQSSIERRRAMIEEERERLRQEYRMRDDKEIKTDTIN